MNALLWIAQVLIAGIFLVTGFGKLLAYDRVVEAVESHKGRPVRLSRGAAYIAAIAEIAGAIGLLVPGHFNIPYDVILCAAAWLALLMVIAGLYHIRRKESAAPNVALFLLALFIIVGRWPRP